MYSRTQKAKLNILTSLTAQVVSMICGIIVPHLLIQHFGSEAYGATTSIANLLAYISLLEGGIAGVARAALYKSIAENNREETSSIYYEIKHFFNIIGYAFIAYTFIVAFLYKSIANQSTFDWMFSFFLVLVISISTLAQYFFGISNSILLQADQRLYINNVLSIVTIIVNTLAVIVLTKLNVGIIYVKLASSIAFLIRPFYLSIYVKRNYSLIPCPYQRKSNALSQKWTGIGQHIAYFLHSNTDIFVLTIFANLKLVAVYSVYSMVVTAIRNLCASFYNGLEALLGNMYAKDETEKLLAVFSYYETLISMVSITMFSTTAVLLVPFVKLYTAGVEDVNYIVPPFAIIIVLAELVYTLRTPYHYMVIAANRFRETKFSAYGEAAINIVLSVGLVFRFGINGIALATLVAMMFRSLYYAIYLSKNVIYRNIYIYIKRNIINAISFSANWVVGEWVAKQFSINQYTVWGICGALVFCTSGVLTFAFNILFYRRDIKALMQKAFAMKKTRI